MWQDKTKENLKNILTFFIKKIISESNIYEEGEKEEKNILK